MRTNTYSSTDDAKWIAGPIVLINAKIKELT